VVPHRKLGEGEKLSVQNSPKLESTKRILISPLIFEIVYISIIFRETRSRRFLEAFEFSPLSPAREEILVKIAAFTIKLLRFFAKGRKTNSKTDNSNSNLFQPSSTIHPSINQSSLNRDLSSLSTGNLI